MANIITISAALSYAISGGGASTGGGSQSLSQTGTHSFNEVVSVGTSAAAIPIGSLANLGFMMFKNLDATNYVEVALDSGMANIISKVLPGGFILISPETTAIYAKAHTAACDCEVTAGEL